MLIYDLFFFFSMKTGSKFNTKKIFAINKKRGGVQRKIEFLMNSKQKLKKRKTKKKSFRITTEVCRALWVADFK